MNPAMRMISIPAAMLVAISLLASPAVAQEEGDSDAAMGGKHQMHGQAEGGMQGMGGGMLGGVSGQEKEALLTGAGLGAGMIAMMNGYPGPKHVLEMGDELELTAAQRESIGTIYGNVKAESVKLGTELVEKDEALAALFASGSVKTGDVEKRAREIGELQGRVRAAHLNAHVETFDALTPAQREQLSSMQGMDEMHEMHQGSGEGMQKRSRQGQSSGT